jgi:glutamyl-tRNA reductase
MSHRSAPIEVREKVAFPPCAGRGFVRRLKDEGIASEAVLLSTCNRTELYAVVESENDRSRVLDLIAEDRGVDRTELDETTYWLTDAEAVGHLYRVAGSLDSMVLGEAQILGQVRDAYRASTEEQSAGSVLNRLFHTSLRVGKLVRTETGIGDSSLSVPRVAVQLAEDVFGSLAGRSALVLGAGEMSEMVIRDLRERGIGEVRIANRTAARALDLAERVGGAAVDFGSVADELPGVDVIVSSTGSGEWVVGNAEVARALERREGPLFFVDIAVPRDVDPVVQTLERAYVYDIDDLQAVVDHNAGEREEAAERAEEIVEPAVFEFMGWMSTLNVVPLIRELRDEAEKVREHEISKALKRTDLTPEQAEAVEKMSRSLVNKLLHGPISKIKSRAESGPPETLETRRRMLGLDGVEVRLYERDSGHGR